MPRLSSRSHSMTRTTVSSLDLDTDQADEKRHIVAKASDRDYVQNYPSSSTQYHVQQLPNGKQRVTTTYTTTVSETHEYDSNAVLPPRIQKYLLNEKASSPLPSPTSSDAASATSTTPHRRLRGSLFRSFVLADWITIMNAVCGVGCLLFCLNFLENGDESYYLTYAFISLPFALFFDLADGWVARKRSQSPYGSDLDSLADCISFTLCPAALAFTIGMRSFWDCLALCFFQFCGLSRLARYNVTSQWIKPGEKVSHYEGFPVPTSLILDAMMYYFYHNGLILEHLPLGYVTLLGKKFHLLSILFIVWGCMFVSASFRIPKP